ncbi:MAG: hypothetical protein AB8H80_22935 [Planctomycetota bacterium]
MATTVRSRRATGAPLTGAPLKGAQGPRRWLPQALAALSIVLLPASFGACDADGTAAPVQADFGGLAVPLSSDEVFRIIQRAVLSIDAINMHVAVTDRTGDILGVYSTVASNATDVQDADNIAVSLARTTSFFSNSQAPLSSRTVETLGAFHFPPTFGSELLNSRLPTSAASASGVTVLAPTRRITGIAGVPQGPLWQINSTNRGADVATAATTPPTAFNTNNVQPGPPGEPIPDPLPANVFFNPSRNINPFDSNNLGTFPSPGITLLPGAVPLFKSNGTRARLVGGVGVYVIDSNGNPDVAAAEFAAIQGASPDPEVAGDPDFFFDDIPLEGAITIVGILLPYVLQPTIPAGFAPRNAAPGFFVTNFDPGNTDAPTRTGRPDPFGYLIGPRPGVDGVGGAVLSQEDVELIIEQCIDSANITRAQVRLPLGSAAKIIATIVDTRGLILAHYRMEDTLLDAVDVVPAKARSTVYYCLPSSDPRSAFANGDTWPGFPVGDARGIALTTRTLGFVSQPFYPPGIGLTANPNQLFDPNNPGAFVNPGNTPPGPLYNLALQNQLDGQVDRWGNSAPDPGYQNGLTFFPGTVPLYKADGAGVLQLVGALGVSGDGVEQNDLIAFEGGSGFEPPPELRIDNFEFEGVKLPYVKFPETPR